jgi:hypothetical protein
VKQPLKEQVVLPPVGDRKVLRRHTDLYKARLLEHTLGRAIVEKGARFNAVESKVEGGAVDDRGDGSRGKSVPRALLRDPISEARTLERPACNTEGKASNDLSTSGDHEGKHGAGVDCPPRPCDLFAPHAAVKYTSGRAGSQGARYSLFAVSAAAMAVASVGSIGRSSEPPGGAEANIVEA